MHRSLLLVAFIVLSLVPAAPAQSQEAARAIIEKGIRAVGGTEKLGRYTAEKVNLRGTLFVRDEVAPFSATTTMQMPSQLKTVLEMTSGGQKHVIVQTVNGDKFGATIDGEAIKVDAAAMADMRSTVQLHQAVRLLPLLTNSRYRLSVVERIKVNRRPAVGVCVSQQGYKDLLLYFDEEQGLLVKSERRLEDGQGKEIREERFYGDYKELGGFLRPTRMAAKRGDKKIMEATLLEARTYERIEPGEFALP